MKGIYKIDYELHFNQGRTKMECEHKSRLGYDSEEDAIKGFLSTWKRKKKPQNIRATFQEAFDLDKELKRIEDFKKWAMSRLSE